MSITRFICTLLTPLLITACGAHDPEHEIAEARKLRQQGDLAAAVVLLNNALNADPQNGEARLLLGTIHRETGRRQVAESHFRAALQAKVDPKVVLPLLVQTLFEQAEFRKVVETTRRSDFGEAALQPEVLSYRGHSLLSLERLEDAASSFEESLQRKPEYAPALLGLARLALLRRDASQARALIDRAIASDSSSIDAWLMKGDIEKALRNGDAAIAAYQKALDLKPNGLAANLNLASMHMRRGELDVARKRLETVLRLAPDAPAARYLLALLEFQNGNYAAADEAVRQVLRNVPGSLPALAFSGVVAYATGANDIAEQRLGNAVSSYPESVYLRKLYAVVLLKSGKVPQATKELETVLKTDPDDPGALALYAEAKFHGGETAVAQKYFELALKQKPDNSGIRAGLGLARLAAGETDRALADLEAAVDLGGASVEGYLVATLIAVKQYERALQAIARLETTRPTDPVIYNLKGSALFAKGDMSAARMAFERALALDPLQVAAATNLAQLDKRENKPSAAQKRFEKILERDPENVAALVALSAFVASMGDRQEALRWAKRAAQINPKAFAPALALAKLHFADGDYANAAPAARIAANAGPGNAEALNMLAHSQLHLGLRTQALETYGTLVKWHPNSAEAHYGLAGAQIADAQFFAAQRGLEKALELRPNFPEAIDALSSVQVRLGRFDEAGKLARETQKRMPKSALGFIIAGDVAMAESRFDQGIRAYEAALKVEKSRSTLIKLLGAMRASGKGAAADALAAAWLKSNPDDVHMLYVAADSAIRNKDFLAAAEHYRTALGLQPGKLEVLHNLGWVYERLNDSRSLEVAESAYRIAPTDPGVLHDLGRLLIANGDVARAINLLEKARLAVPESQHVRYQLALAYTANGSNSQARAELTQLLRSQQEFLERDAAKALLSKLER